MSDIHSLFQQALETLGAGKADHAWQAYEQLIRSCPQEPAGYLGLAHAMLASPDYATREQVLQTLSQAVSCPGSPEFAENRRELLHYGSGDTQKTLLMIACESLRYDLVQGLVQLGANIHMKTTDGETALFFAVSRPHSKEQQKEALRIAEYLLSLGAEADIRSADGTPLYHKGIDRGILKRIAKRYPQLTIAPIPADMPKPDHGQLFRNYLIIGAAAGLLIGLMAESLLAALALAVVLAAIGLFAAGFTVNALEKNPMAGYAYGLYALLFAAVIALMIAFVYFVSDGNFGFGNIFDLFFQKKASSGSSFGSYQGWGAGYNPLTGKVYD